ncbi:MAG: YadA-like family protein, partial [Acidaminococcaceae bacterium]|nr:YadA-like family protein [Acidaminococcaceae bacterium]
NNTYVAKAEVTQAATDTDDKVKVQLSRNDGKSFDLDLNNTYVAKAEVTQEAADDSADVKVQLTRNDGESFNLDLKDKYVAKAEVTKAATDEDDNVKVQLTRNDGQSFDLDLNNTYVAKAEVTQAATDESDAVKVQLSRNDGKSFDLDLNNTYVAKAEVTQAATDESDKVKVQLSRNDGKSFDLDLNNTYVAKAELSNHTLTLTRNDGTAFTVQDLATVDDGMTYAGDTGSATVKLNKSVSVTGGASELTDGNIGVVASQDGENAKLEVKLAKDINDVDSITVNKNIKVGDNTTIEGDTITTKSVNTDTVKAGDTTINNDGVTINEGPSVTKDGIDANNTKITNVTPGTADSDAATVGQVNNGLGDLRNEISHLDNRMKKGIAGAAALAALHPMDFNPDDKMQFSAGVGNYRGETAAAVGAFYRPDESVMFSIGGTFGNGDNMVNAGITFGLDGTRNRVTRSRTAMAKEIVELRSLVTQMAARMDRMEAANGIETAMFPDVPENHWAYEYVEDLQKSGALKGYPDGLFKGDRAMTRYEFAAMLDRIVRSGVTLSPEIAKEFEPELGRIYVERISGQDNDRKKIERVRVNNSDSKYPEGKNRDVYGSKIMPVAPEKAVSK